jgi:hypothetical protein
LKVERLFNKEGALDALYPDYVVSLALRTNEHRHGNGPGFTGRSRLLMNFDWLVPRRNRMPDALKPAPFAASAAGTYAPRWASSLVVDCAVFTRFYAGYDYYNMNFDKDIYRVDFGLMLGSGIGFPGAK